MYLWDSYAIAMPGIWDEFRVGSRRSDWERARTFVTPTVEFGKGGG